MGGSGSAKSAYCLVYINQFIAEQLNRTPFPEYAQSSLFRVEESLKRHVQEQNLRFNEESTKFKVEKIVRQIVEKHKARMELLQSYSDTQNSMVQVNLINFHTYLKHLKLQQFCRWHILNICMREEHPAQLNLYSLPSDDLIFQHLTKYFTSNFLKITEKEKKSLLIKMDNFRHYQKACAVIALILLNLNQQNNRVGLSAFLYFKAYL